MANLIRCNLLNMCVFVVLIMSCGCAARTQIAPNSIVSGSVNSKYKNLVFVEFSVSDAFDEAAALDPYVYRCEHSAMDNLRNRSIFSHVENGDASSFEDSSMLVYCKLTDLRIVSGAARFWGGALVGRSHMKVDVRLVSGDTGETVHEKELLGAPNALGSAWSGGSTDQRLPEEMGRLIANYILAHVDE